jgi:hypothetical protein
MAILPDVAAHQSNPRCALLLATPWAPLGSRFGVVLSDLKIRVFALKNSRFYPKKFAFFLWA